MHSPYISLLAAAEYENVSFETIRKRIRRNPAEYTTHLLPREDGGKPMVFVAVSSLSSKAQRAYATAQQKMGAEAAIKEHTEGKEAPWYVTVDFNWFQHNHAREYDEALRLREKVCAAQRLPERGFTAALEQLAQEANASLRSFYRYVEAIREAAAWSLKLQKEDGFSREVPFQAMALCRKPRDMNTFPSLPKSYKDAITSIWFNEELASNHPSMELAYARFMELANRRGWTMIPSSKTVVRYIKYLMSDPRNEHAHYLAAEGARAYRNKMLQKGKRDTASLYVMEFVQGDEHTFDLWVKVRDANGRERAIRPKLVAWVDTRTRCIMGDVVCETPNAAIIKQSIAKMIYSTPGGVPEHLHMDNGRDYTARKNTGQDRDERQMLVASFDSEVQGFYRQVGIEAWSRSLPYRPWGKGQIERFFRTVCEGFSKLFASYTGTLTGSKTTDKRSKDIDRMLKEGKLLTLEAFYAEWERWKNEVYHVAVHRGLKNAGEAYTTPAELFQHATRYEKPVPPQDFVAYLLMETATARVTNQGINKFNTLYTGAELCYYIGKIVNVRWNANDVSSLHVFAQDGSKICEAVAHELLQFTGRVSQEALEKHIRNQKRQENDTRGRLRDLSGMDDMTMEEMAETAHCVGHLDMTIKAKDDRQVIRLPRDKEYCSEVNDRAKASREGRSDFFMQLGNEAWDQMEAANH